VLNVEVEKEKEGGSVRYGGRERERRRD
jgi:hypothetical protein